MSDVRTKAERLLAALDELADEERIWLGAGRVGPALAAHRRAAPLLAEFCRIAVLPGSGDAVRAGLVALQERRRRNLELLFELRTRLLAEGERIAAARLRLSKVVRTYRRRRRRASGAKRLRVAV